VLIYDHMTKSEAGSITSSRPHVCVKKNKATGVLTKKKKKRLTSDSVIKKKAEQYEQRDWSLLRVAHVTAYPKQLRDSRVCIKIPFSLHDICVLWHWFKQEVYRLHSPCFNKASTCFYIYWPHHDFIYQCLISIYKRDFSHSCCKASWREVFCSN
jgi:hypothetical protein